MREQSEHGEGGREGGRKREREREIWPDDYRFNVDLVVCALSCFSLLSCAD